MRIAAKPRRRSAFTLIELLVVIAIIAILGALVAGAIHRLVGSQQLKRTEATVKKTQTGLEIQWKAVIDDAKDDIKNHKVQNVMATPGGFNAQGVTDSDAANALYVKMKLKIEFPQTFQEARAPGLNTFGLLPKAVYTQEVQNFNIEPEPPGNPQKIAEARQKESAVLLFLALSQTRRGTTFNVDEMGGSVKVMDVNVRNLATNVVSPRQFKVIVDAWGVPITFQRFADNALASEMTQYGGTDPMDPYGKLQRLPLATRNSFQNLLADMFNGQNHSFVIRSWGPDKTFNSNDDILGFRLMKEGQRGN